MKRAEEYLRIWKASRGSLRAGANVAIVGCGVSGLHLAYFLNKRGLAVTLFDPQRRSGVRVPLVHACHTVKVRAPLWENAATFAREWYQHDHQPREIIEAHRNDFGLYFNIRLRSYLSFWRKRLMQNGVVFKYESIAAEQPLAGFDLTFLAKGAATTTLTATRTIPGWESYFSRFGAPAEKANIGKNGNKITNYIHMARRAGFIHRNDETAETAVNFAAEIHPTGRRALFYGERLTTRDRFPVVGLAGGTWLFCAMGYHALTYTPYLAQTVAAHLCGDTVADENLISTLTPARFLPRSGAQGVQASNAARGGSA